VARIDLGDIAVHVVRKDIKHLHLSVEPPSGRVRIAAPQRLSLDTIRLFAIRKLGWIRDRQRLMQAQPRQQGLEYLDRESHHVWGRRYLLRVVEREACPSVSLTPRKLVLQVRPGADQAKRQQVLDAWYGDALKRAVPPLIAKWESLMGVQVERFFVQRMKTQWGACNVARRSIRLNTELARKPPECLEYIVVHEMAHLLEPAHGARFRALMDWWMPNWPIVRDQLNHLPVRRELWMVGGRSTATA
jgi:predicted metal-dependent hydrolase